MGGSGGDAVHTRRSRYSFASACIACCINWFESSHSHISEDIDAMFLCLAFQKDSSICQKRRETMSPTGNPVPSMIHTEARAVGERPDGGGSEKACCDTLLYHQHLSRPEIHMPPLWKSGPELD